MADQPINGLPKKTAALDTDAVLMIGASEEYQIDYGKLADAILNKLTSKTFALEQGSKSLVAALNELNSKTEVKNMSFPKPNIEGFEPDIWVAEIEKNGTNVYLHLNISGKISKLKSEIIAFTLPKEFRPLKVTIINFITQSGKPMFIQVKTTGEVAFYANTTSEINEFFARQVISYMSV